MAVNELISPRLRAAPMVGKQRAWPEALASCWPLSTTTPSVRCSLPKWEAWILGSFHV